MKTVSPSKPSSGKPTSNPNFEQLKPKSSKQLENIKKRWVGFGTFWAWFWVIFWGICPSYSLAIYFVQLALKLEIRNKLALDWALELA